LELTFNLWFVLAVY